jgi:phosphoenolpyruvate synthase/pyruvate phosphate dikinase
VSDKLVYDFTEGSRDMRELLGGKGANVAEMTRVLGAGRVPAGFTITTEACVAYMRDGTVPDEEIAARTRPAPGWATPTTRCSCPCAAERASRCQACSTPSSTWA